RDFDLNISARQLTFNTEVLIFNPNNQKAIELELPSLAQYRVKPWELYHVLRYSNTEGVRICKEVDPRWGRYMLLSLKEKWNILHFDPRSSQLLVPASVPLPVE